MAVRVQLACLPEQSRELLWCLADAVESTRGASFAVTVEQRSKIPIRLDFMLGTPLLAKENVFLKHEQSQQYRMYLLTQRVPSCGNEKERH